MTPALNNAEDPSKKPAPLESVDNLIQKKQNERQTEGADAVHQGAQGVKEGVADVMAGMEVASDTISERRDRKGDGDLKTGGGGVATQSDDDDVSQIHQNLGNIKNLSEEVMIRKIRIAVKGQIKTEMKRANQLRKNLSSGNAHEYTQSIARIRRLGEVLNSLAIASAKLVKDMYLKYFTPQGRRRPAAEVSLD